MPYVHYPGATEPVRITRVSNTHTNPLLICLPRPQGLYFFACSAPLLWLGEELNDGKYNNKIWSTLTAAPCNLGGLSTLPDKYNVIEFSRHLDEAKVEGCSSADGTQVEINHIGFIELASID